MARRPGAWRNWGVGALILLGELGWACPDWSAMFAHHRAANGDSPAYFSDFSSPLLLFRTHRFYPISSGNSWGIDVDTNSIDAAKDSLIRVQEFQIGDLPRREELGSAMSFEESLDHARRSIRLFQQIPIDHLQDLPEADLKKVKSNADTLYNTFSSMLAFSPSSADNPAATRTQLIEQLKSQYDSFFQALHPLIAYLTSRQRDFAALEREARAAVQSAADEARTLKDQLLNDREEAQRILEEVRRVAAEQGVSQQAVYFKEEAEKQDVEAEKWRTYTVRTSIGLGMYAVASVAVYKIPFFTPADNYQAIQLSIGKLIIFAVAAYMLFLCARNFLSHKHNAIVNRHRQNALLTFNALSDAARGEDKRDIVLVHAAACIFSPQDTGYTRHSSGQEAASTKLIEVLPKLGNSAS